MMRGGRVTEIVALRPRKVLQALCAHCGERLVHPRPNKRFCGSTCRVYALRTRRRGGLTAAAVGP